MCLVTKEISWKETYCLRQSTWSSEPVCSWTPFPLELPVSPRLQAAVTALPKARRIYSISPAKREQTSFCLLLFFLASFTLSNNTLSRPRNSFILNDFSSELIFTFYQIVIYFTHCRKLFLRFVYHLQSKEMKYFTSFVRIFFFVFRFLVA